jgi:putative ABC transport system permease protein
VEIFDLIYISLRTLAKNKLRSSLTVLGVVIGIAAVTTMVSIGQGAGQLVRNAFESIGSNFIVVVPAPENRGGVRQGVVTTLTAADGAAIAKECPSVLAVSPLVGASGQVIRDNINWQPAQMFGVGTDYVTVRNWQMQSGEFFGERDIAGGNKVCVIGNTLVAHLFPDTDPIGKQVRVATIPFTVVGVLARKGANLFGQDQDDIILFPFTTVRKRLTHSAFANVDLLMVASRSEATSFKAQQEISSVLSERHRTPPGEKSDFEIHSTAEVAGVLTTITGALTAMLASIAAISLLVGGVGIMNIMLVSVTERTREIGIRMALGARPRDILWQFLVEAVVLSSIGGLLGIVIGLGGSFAVNFLINWLLPTAKWPFVVSIPATVIAIVFSAAVGIFFGFYPARRASRLDPIEALRYD